MIHLGMFLPAKPDRRWRLAAQAGVRRAISRLRDAYEPWDESSLAAAQASFREAGFALTALEGDQFDMSRIKQGLPGREEDYDRYRAMLAAMGRLGIRTLCHNFMAGIGWFRSRHGVPGRGGALTSAFHPGDVPDEPPHLTHEQLWANYREFLGEVLPAAEAAGVTLALHPDDPPVPWLAGWPRIFTSADGYRRALEFTHGSPAFGITFCAATFRAMGEDDLALLREWRDRIVFVHLRDNRPLPDGGFEETFHDDGPTDLARRLRLLDELGMDVLLRPDHAPTMDGEDNADPGYAAFGRVFAIGYFKGILDAAGIAHD